MQSWNNRLNQWLTSESNNAHEENKMENFVFTVVGMVLIRLLLNDVAKNTRVVADVLIAIQNCWINQNVLIVAIEDLKIDIVCAWVEVWLLGPYADRRYYAQSWIIYLMWYCM